MPFLEYTTNKKRIITVYIDQSQHDDVMKFIRKVRRLNKNG